MPPQLEKTTLSRVLDNRHPCAAAVAKLRPKLLPPVSRPAALASALSSGSSVASASNSTMSDSHDRLSGPSLCGCSSLRGPLSSVWSSASTPVEGFLFLPSTRPASICGALLICCLHRQADSDHSTSVRAATASRRPVILRPVKSKVVSIERFIAAAVAAL